ncbi:alpha/beta hydrolase [Phanerochaete sordida]|uniref:Alpha/beta hydrolase n=1 Tax=Phanerochaete sordida TaxID=48140 RepID=A0A9P3FXA2_9APHY|nr:alpha/beta hydrolase [Phanerochaete sordida]
MDTPTAIPTENGAQATEILEDISEKLHLPRRRALSFYIVLIIAVFPLWSVIPLSWAFVVYSLHSGNIWSYTWKGLALFAVALAEVFFSVYHHHLSRCIAGPPPNIAGNLSELQAAFRRVLQSGLADLPEHGYDEEDVGRPGSPEEDIIALERSDPRAVDFRNYLRTWFGKVPWSHIRRDDIFAWLHWSIFNAPFTSFDALPFTRQKVLLDVLQMIEKRAGATIPDGSNPKAKPLLLTLDPISVSWRPFVWYAGVALSNYYQRRQYEAQWNAKVTTYKGMEYILRIPHGWSMQKGPRPVIFLHGLGLGLTQYKMFLSNLLRAAKDRPVLVPLQPHVSQELFHPNYLKPMNRHQSADVLAELLEELGWARRRSDDSDSSVSEEPKGVTVLSHSNGSFLHAWLLKAYPEMVSRSCFVDPVTFCSWEGDLCYNFIYRRCTNGLELVMKYFVGMELGVANFLQRHFDWSANALWYEQIPNARDPSKTMFFLGGKDAIVDASRVKRYLTSHGIRKGLWYDPNGRHGQALLAGGAGHAAILRWLREPESNTTSS